MASSNEDFKYDEEDEIDESLSDEEDRVDWNEVITEELLKGLESVSLHKVAVRITGLIRSTEFDKENVEKMERARNKIVRAIAYTDTGRASSFELELLAIDAQTLNIIIDTIELKLKIIRIKGMRE